jgi:hypothetical protein
MLEIDGTTPYAVLLAHGDDAVTAAVAQTLESQGWTVDLQRGEARSAAESAARGRRVDGVVYVPGLLAGSERDSDEPACVLMDLVESLRPCLRAQKQGGARVVAVGSRDWLGWPSRPRVAARAAGLVAAVRSLALAYGRAGITVNAVIGIPMDAARRRAAGAVPGTHLSEPVPLTGEPVTPEDIAATVSFFLDPGSAYITGQVLHCCGGASLLSSLSV